MSFETDALPIGHAKADDDLVHYFGFLSYATGDVL